MKYSLAGVLLLAVVCATCPATAGGHWAVEIRGGGAFPTTDLGDADLGTGFGLEGTVSYRFLPHLAGYAGWGWTRFSADQSFAGADADFEETGYTFGFQFIHPIGDTKVSYLIRGGGVYNHIEIENSGGDITVDSGHGLGWQVGAGLVWSVAERWRLAPSVRYRALSRDFEIGDVDLNYVSAGLGLAVVF